MSPSFQGQEEAESISLEHMYRLKFYKDSIKYASNSIRKKNNRKQNFSDLRFFQN